MWWSGCRRKLNKDGINQVKKTRYKKPPEQASSDGFLCITNNQSSNGLLNPDWNIGHVVVAIGLGNSIVFIDNNT